MDGSRLVGPYEISLCPIIYRNISENACSKVVTSEVERFVNKYSDDTLNPVLSASVCWTFRNYIYFTEQFLFAKVLFLGRLNLKKFNAGLHNYITASTILVSREITYNNYYFGHYFVL